MNTTKSKIIKSIDTKLHYHKMKIHELEETKNLLTEKPIKEKTVVKK